MSDYPDYDQLIDSRFVPFEHKAGSDSVAGELQSADVIAGMPGIFELSHVLTTAEYDALLAHHDANETDSFKMTWKMPVTPRDVHCHWLEPPERIPLRPTATGPDRVRAISRLVKDRYRVDASTYNGATDMTVSSIGTFTDNKRFTFCCAIKPNGSRSTQEDIINIGGAQVLCRLGGSGLDAMVFLARNSGASNILDVTSINQTLVDDQWNSVLASFDLADTHKIYINGEDVSDTSPTTFTDDTIAISGDEAGFGNNHVGTNWFQTGSLAHVAFWPTVYIDLSTRAVRNAFFDSRGRPVEWPDGGLRINGVRPAIWAPDGDPRNNLGSANDFTLAAGALSASSDSPTD